MSVNYTSTQSFTDNSLIGWLKNFGYFYQILIRLHNTSVSKLLLPTILFHKRVNFIYLNLGYRYRESTKRFRRFIKNIFNRA